MVPFDIHDPALDPMCASGTDAGKFAWGTAYNGHFDQTGHFEGEVRVRGKRYAIDCVSTMDHSWGPRPERGKPNMSWLHAHVDKKTALHAIMGFDATLDDSKLTLAHGYVVDGGELRGLASGSGTVRRRVDRFPDSLELSFADGQGRQYALQGRALTSFPWQCWPNMVSFNALAEWQFQGRRAYGEVQDFFELPQLNRLNSERAAASLRRAHASRRRSNLSPAPSPSVRKGGYSSYPRYTHWIATSPTRPRNDAAKAFYATPGDAGPKDAPRLTTTKRRHNLSREDFKRARALARIDTREVRRHDEVRALVVLAERVELAGHGRGRTYKKIVRHRRIAQFFGA